MNCCYEYTHRFISGANPNSEDNDSRTPVHSAIVKGSRSNDCVRLLLEAGADVNHKDRYVQYKLRERAWTGCVKMSVTHVNSR